MTSISANPRRKPEPDLVDLPHGIRVALRRIVADMRDIPRDAILDRAEMVHWVNRMARRVEGVERTKVTVDRPLQGPPALAPAAPKPVSPTEAAEAVFKSNVLPAAKRSGRRTITSRRGRAVLVETRQLVLFGGVP